MSINKNRYRDYYDKKAGYHRVPNEIWETDLDHTCKVIWCYLLSRDLNWDSSRNNLARNLGLHRNTVSNCVEKLEYHNMLRITSPGRQSWDFEILPPSDWTIDFFGKDDVHVQEDDAHPGNRDKMEPVPPVCIQDLQNVHTSTSREPHPRREEGKKEESPLPNKESTTSKTYTEQVSYHTGGAPVTSGRDVNGARSVVHSQDDRNMPSARSVTAAHTTPSLEDVVMSWFISVPDNNNSKDRASYLFSLYELMKAHGYSELSRSLKNKVKSKFIKAKGQKMPQQQYDKWSADVDADLERQHAEVFLQKVVLPKKRIIIDGKDITEMIENIPDESERNEYLRALVKADERKKEMIKNGKWKG